MKVDIIEESSSSSFSSRFLPSIVLALLTLATRILCHGPIYFADGPRQVQSILDKVYIIQPPGYWLFDRIAGIFPNPTLAIESMNILFSIVGVVMFYHTATLFTTRLRAFFGALAYSAIFYVWFAGEVHSTYAPQILFPILFFFSLLHLDRNQTWPRMCGVAAIFALGAGLRPFDGLFLIPMLLYFCVARLPRDKGIALFGLALVLCLSWLVPTVLAFNHSSPGTLSALAYMFSIMKVRSIATGVNAGTLANVVRYVLPLLIAFWPVLPAAMANTIQDRDRWQIRMILLWILPGSIFFIFSYISDAPYLTYLSAAILLLAIKAPRMMAVTAAWNAAIFLFLVPVPSQLLLVNTWNCDIGKYTLFAIRNQWQPNLSQLQSQVLRRHD